MNNVVSLFCFEHKIPRSQKKEKFSFTFLIFNFFFSAFKFRLHNTKCIISKLKKHIYI